MMAGLGLALLGGAMQGWSKGQLEEIKQQREEKLRLLEQQFTHPENELTRQAARQNLETQLGVTQSEGALTRTSEEKRSRLAQEGETERARLAQEGANARAKALRETQERIAGTRATIEGGQTGTMDVNNVFHPDQDEQGKLVKAIKEPTGALRGNGQDMEHLVNHGVSFPDAKRRAFESAGKSQAEREDLNYRALLDAGKKNFGDTSPEELDALSQHARRLAREMSGEQTG